MTDKNFVNMHVLISHSPSCLNRDDMNLQKTAVFGGVTRVRISSQSLKRAMRKPPKNAANYWVNTLGQPSVRTRNLNRLRDEFSEALKSEFPPALISKTIDLFAKTKNSTGEEQDEDATDLDNSTSKSVSKGQPVAPWVLAEIRELCQIVQAVALNDQERAAAIAKHKKQKGKKATPEQQFLDDALHKKIERSVQEKADTIRRAWSEAADVALFGRMATSGLMSSVDGAMAVAHAITTHAVEPQDVDWFTAVDDLVQDSGDSGAGHLDTQQFSSGVFYRYASLNIRQLQENLGNASRERALEIAKHLFHMLTTVVPSAKQQAFAAHNPADFAIVSLADQPISLANAFEAPVQRDGNGGFLGPSIKALHEYWEKMSQAYALDELAAAFALTRSDLPKGMKPLARLPDIEAWIARGGKD